MNLRPGARPTLEHGFYADHEDGRWYLYDLGRRRFRRLGPLLCRAVSLCDGRHTVSEIAAELDRAGAGRDGALSLLTALGECGCLGGSGAAGPAGGGRREGTQTRAPQVAAASLGPEWVSDVAAAAGAGPGELEVGVGGRSLPYRLSFDERGRLAAVHCGPGARASPGAVAGGKAPAAPRAAVAAFNGLVAWLFGRDSPVSDGGRLRGPAVAAGLLPWAPRPGLSRALDAGAGSGYLAGALARRGWVPLLVDQSGPAAPPAEATGQAGAAGHAVGGGRFGDGNGVGAQRVVAELENLPFADGSFELATCFYVLEHVAEPAAVLGEVARVLAPGGQLLLLVPTPSAGDWLRDLFRGRGGRQWQHRRVYGLPHPRAPGVEDVRRLPAQLQQAGLEPRLVRAVWGARATRRPGPGADAGPAEGRLGRWLAGLPLLRWLGPAVAVAAVKGGDPAGAGRPGPGSTAVPAELGPTRPPPGVEVPVGDFWREVARNIASGAHLCGARGLPPALALGVALDEVFGGLARHRVHLGPGPLVLVASSGCPLQPGGDPTSTEGGEALPRPDLCRCHAGAVIGALEGLMKTPLDSTLGAPQVPGAPACSVQARVGRRCSGPPDTVRVRPAVPGDIPVLAAMSREMHEVNAALDPALEPRPDFEALYARELEGMFAGKGDEGRAFVAEDGGVPVGCSQGAIWEFPYLAEPRRGFISMVYVTPQRRRRGVGTALALALLAWFQQEGATPVQMNVVKGNRAALRFWRALGFAPVCDRLEGRAGGRAPVPPP